MKTVTLKDGAEIFMVSVHEATRTSPVVLFAAGAGGLPERYATLLDTLCKSGCTVVAPHFERLASPVPSEAELILRARRLSFALEVFAPAGVTAVGVGHSIGASILVALVGGVMWLGPERRVDIVPDIRLTRLVVLAPPTGFFHAPGALDAVRVPMLAWVGSEDTITPPEQTEWLARSLYDPRSVSVRITEGAGHFSFMDAIPPQAVEPFQNKQAFLSKYSSEVCKFARC